VQFEFTSLFSNGVGVGLVVKLEERRNGTAISTCEEQGMCVASFCVALLRCRNKVGDVELLTATSTSALFKGGGKALCSAPMNTSATITILRNPRAAPNQTLAMAYACLVAFDASSVDDCCPGCSDLDSPVALQFLGDGGFPLSVLWIAVGFLSFGVCLCICVGTVTYCDRRPSRSPVPLDRDLVATTEQPQSLVDDALPQRAPFVAPLASQAAASSSHERCFDCAAAAVPTAENPTVNVATRRNSNMKLKVGSFHR
jgi:hypothetical protein